MLHDVTKYVHLSHSRPPPNWDARSFFHRATQARHKLRPLQSLGIVHQVFLIAEGAQMAVAAEKDFTQASMSAWFAMCCLRTATYVRITLLYYSIYINICHVWMISVPSLLITGCPGHNVGT